jgi:hypothetical protein
MKSSITILAALVLAASQVSAFCSADPDRTQHYCCRSSGPFSSNANVWENICGVHTSDPNMLVGGGCEPLAGDWW